ncbi:MAG: WG repeat-containing protein, partial [Oscillospiraceae bacterium]|nr:WG repeat-containing protein [Oscillospiraceae bacterium]
MKKRVIGIILVFCMVFSMLPMMAFAAESGSRYVLEQEKRSEAIYTAVGAFRDGYAPVQNAEGKWGYIHESGKIAVDCKYDWANYYSEGVALVGNYAAVWSEPLEDYYEGTEFYLIDMKGKEIKLDTSSKPCLNMLETFDYSFVCKNGIVNACGVPFTADGEPIIVKNPEVLETTGYIEYIDGTRVNAYDFFVMTGTASAEGLISMETDGIGQMSAYQNFIMDSEGNIVRSFEPRDIDYSYSGVDNVWLAEDGMLIIRSAGYEEQWWESNAKLSYRVEDAFGNVIIPEGSFENFFYILDGRFFCDGLLVVMDENDNYGAIDAEGKVVIDFIYDYMAPFGGGYASVLRDGEYIYVDTKGNEYEVVGVDGEKTRLNDASRFKNGFAWVHDSNGFYYLISDRQVDGKLYPVENSADKGEVGADFYESNGLYGVCWNTVTEKKTDVTEAKVGDSFVYVDDVKLELSKPIIDIYEVTYEEYVLLPDELQNEFGSLRERVEKTDKVYVLEEGTEVSFPYGYTWGAGYSYFDFEGTGVYAEDMASGGYTPNYWPEEIVLPVKWTLSRVNENYISCWDIIEMLLDKNGDYMFADGRLKTNFEGKFFYEVRADETHVHEYESVVTAPTCTEEGYTTHTCACGDSYTDTTVAATGHKWDDGKVTIEPTEETEGVRTFTCTVCSATKTETIAPLAHEHDYASEVVAPTCTEDGYTVYTCACGDTYGDYIVKATGHKWDDGKVTTEPTAEKEGVKTFTCTVCSETKTEKIDKLPEEEKPDEPIENPFLDVNDKDFFFQPVMWAVANNVTSGLSATAFGPSKGCTRAQVVTFLWRAAGEPAPTSDVNPFADVKEGQYYYDAVLWAVENGITTGLNATTFGTNADCNRGQIVTFLWR